MCAVVLAVQGCGGGGGHSPTEPEPTVDSLTLVRIEPAQGTALRRGSQVTFRSRLAYTTARSTQGTIVAIVRTERADPDSDRVSVRRSCRGAAARWR